MLSWRIKQWLYGEKWSFFFFTVFTLYVDNLAALSAGGTQLQLVQTLFDSPGGVQRQGTRDIHHGRPLSEEEPSRSCMLSIMQRVQQAN